MIRDELFNNEFHKGELCGWPVWYDHTHYSYSLRHRLHSLPFCFFGRNAQKMLKAHTWWNTGANVQCWIKNALKAVVALISFVYEWRFTICDLKRTEVAGCFVFVYTGCASICWFVVFGFTDVLCFPVVVFYTRSFNKIFVHVIPGKIMGFCF